MIPVNTDRDVETMVILQSERVVLVVIADEELARKECEELRHKYWQEHVKHLRMSYEIYCESAERDGAYGTRLPLFRCVPARGVWATAPKMGVSKVKR